MTNEERIKALENQVKDLNDIIKDLMFRLELLEDNEENKNWLERSN